MKRIYQSRSYKNKTDYETKQQTCILTLIYYNFDVFAAKSKHTHDDPASRSKSTGCVDIS